MSTSYNIDAHIAECVERRDFLSICESLDPNYKWIVSGVIPKSENLTEDYIRKAADKAGCLAEFERDFALAPLAVASERALKRYAEFYGKSFRVDDYGNLLEGRKSKSKDAQEYDVRVSSPLIVCGEGHNPSNGGACLQLLVKSTIGTWNEVFIARAQLVGGGNVQALLQDAGYGRAIGKYCYTCCKTSNRRASLSE